MRVLLTTNAQSGHWHPLMPLAQALAAAGHDVAFATAPAGCAEISPLGVRCFSVGADETLAELAARERRLAQLAPHERAAIFWSEVFPKSRAERALPDLLAVVRSWRPAVIVREMVEFAGCIAAEREGVPHVAVQVVSWRPRLHPLLITPLNQLRASVGLPPDAGLEMLYHFGLFVMSPPSFRDSTLPFPPAAHDLRPLVFDQSGSERLPDWVDQLPTKPVVYATMGTINNRTPGVLEAILDGLRDEAITLIMTTGRDRDPADLGVPPPNVHIERYVPQSLLFPRCNLIVTHGGTGTMMAALAHGLPMVILPVAADQPDNAQRCVALGVAETLEANQRTAQAIRSAVRAVLADPSYRQAATRLRREIEAMPGPEQAVEALERLVATNEPIPAL